jgi:hypothetical protein
LIAVPVFVFGYTIEGDPKGRYVFMQLAIMPAALLLFELGGESMLRSWLNSFPVLFALNLALTYGVGWGVGVIAEKARGGNASPGNNR